MNRLGEVKGNFSPQTHPAEREIFSAVMLFSKDSHPTHPLFRQGCDFVSSLLDDAEQLYVTSAADRDRLHIFAFIGI